MCRIQSDCVLECRRACWVLLSLNHVFPLAPWLRTSALTFSVCLRVLAILRTRVRFHLSLYRLLVNTLVLPSTSALSAQPTDAPRTYASTTIFFTRSVVFPSATSPKAEWKTSDSLDLVSSMHTRLFSRSTRKSNVQGTHAWQMKGCFDVAGGSCLKSPVFDKGTHVHNLHFLQKSQLLQQLEAVQRGSGGARRKHPPHGRRAAWHVPRPRTVRKPLTSSPRLSLRPRR